MTGFSDEDFDRRYRDRVTLECPQCGRRLAVDRDRCDPPLAVRVLAHCDRCPGEDNGLVDYFDADGNQVFPE